MLRADIEKKLIKSVKIGNNDTAKKTAISKWCSYYWSVFEKLHEDELNFIGDKLSEKSSWNTEITEINKEELDKKIISLDENPMSERVIYHLACCGCNEKYIRELFFSEIDLDSIEPEKLLKYVKMFYKDNLMIFWSHYINESKLKDCEDFGKEKSWTAGFQCAIKDENIGAMDFFWQKINDDSFITDDEKEKICMQPALYKGMNTESNADMIEFTMKCLDELGDAENRYYKLLETESKGKKTYLTIHKLTLEHRFNSVQKLFKSLKPDDVSCKWYTSSMFNLLNALTKIAETITSDLKSKGDFDNTKDFIESINIKLLKEGEELLGVMWNPKVFEKQTKYFIEEKINAQFSPARERIASLIKMNSVFHSKTLSTMVKSIEKKHMERINRFDPSSADILNSFMQTISSMPESGTSSSSRADSSADSPGLSFLHKGAGDIGDQ